MNFRSSFLDNTTIALHNIFTYRTRRLHRSLLTNTCTDGCNDFSRLVTALHSKSESVSFIVLTANLSCKLVTFLQSLILHFCPYRCWGTQCLQQHLKTSKEKHTNCG